MSLYKTGQLKENQNMGISSYTSVGNIGTRTANNSRMDDIAYTTREYTDENTNHTKSELSVFMCAEGGHITGAVPVIDVLKYVMLHHPEIVERAHAELSDTRAAEAKRDAEEVEAEAFCEAFLAAFPSKKESERLACDATQSWMKVIDGRPTSGEGCFIEGLPLVDYYDGREPLYLFSVLKRVCDWAETQGWRAELANPGTVKFYKD
jgi:hypothetical protein